MQLPYSYFELEKVQDAISIDCINEERKAIFNKTQNVEKYFEIDETNHFWKVPSFFPSIIFSYRDIVNFELLENGQSITKGGLGNAIIGGALFGGVGAIVGGTIGKKTTKQEITEYRIKIITKNVFCPEIYINFLATGKTKYGSLLYNSYANYAQKILSLLNIITSEPTVPESNAASISIADEIIKFKQLLDDGIITQEEFIQKKKQLLNP